MAAALPVIKVPVSKVNMNEKLNELFLYEIKLYFM